MTRIVRWDKNIDQKWNVVGTSALDNLRQNKLEILPSNDIWVYQIMNDYTYMVYSALTLKFVDRSRNYLPYNKENKNHLEIIDPVKMLTNEKIV